MKAVWTLAIAVLLCGSGLAAPKDDVVVVKAQIHAGGRGKGGGVKLARDAEECESVAKGMLGMTLRTHQTGPEGRIVRRLLIEQGMDLDGAKDTVRSRETNLGSLLADAMREAAGADVALVYRRSRPEAEETAGAVRALGRRSVVFQGDLRDPETCGRVVDETVDSLGRIDVLVNMASIYLPKPVDDVTVEDWDAQIDVDLRSAWLCARAAVPHMRRLRGGRPWVRFVAGLRLLVLLLALPQQFFDQRLVLLRLDQLRLQLERLQHDKPALLDFGLDVVTRLCETLLRFGAPGLHFYCMNQSGLTAEICRRLDRG